MSDAKNVIVEKNKAWWFIIAQEKIILQEQDESIPYGDATELSLPASMLSNKINIGEYQSHPCYLIVADDACAFKWGSFKPARILLGKIDAILFNMLGRALQVSLFYQTHQYCGRVWGKNAAH